MSIWLIKIDKNQSQLHSARDHHRPHPSSIECFRSIDWLLGMGSHRKGYITMIDWSIDGTEPSTSGSKWLYL